MDRIRDIEGIYSVDDSKRYYPNRNFASHILGFTGTDNQGLTAWKRFDRYLYGLPGRNIAETDAAGRRIPFGFGTQYSPQDGYHLVLTIDEVVQHFAEKAIEEAVINNKAKKGTAIVMDPKTGDILALAVKPDYDPNTPFDPVNEQERELWRPFGGRTEGRKAQNVEELCCIGYIRARVHLQGNHYRRRAGGRGGQAGQHFLLQGLHCGGRKNLRMLEEL